MKECPSNCIALIFAKTSKKPASRFFCLKATCDVELHCYLYTSIGIDCGFWLLISLCMIFFKLLMEMNKNWSNINTQCNWSQQATASCIQKIESEIMAIMMELLWRMMKCSGMHRWDSCLHQTTTSCSVIQLWANFTYFILYYTYIPYMPNLV